MKKDAHFFSQHSERSQSRVMTRSYMECTQDTSDEERTKPFKLDTPRKSQIERQKSLRAEDERISK